MSEIITTRLKQKLTLGHTCQSELSFLSLNKNVSSDLHRMYGVITITKKIPGLVEIEFTWVRTKNK